MARISYKKLYLETKHTLHETADRLKNVQRRLDEVNRALVPYGAKTLDEFDYDRDHIAIGLKPLEFCAARAFFESLSRFAGMDTDSGWTNYVWRERPVMRL